MAYLALYREWRPQSFQEIAGQEHVTRTLVNALASGRVSHAYLFCGPRGTGKTTTAKVLAKALNCRSRQSAEPCNVCQNCREITAGNSLDVIEIDAASHRGIDEIRDLREKVRFAPTTGNYRVYIIDEVHMLTPEAFNALLKTLEEPPAHVVFVLATTEPHKVPLTILSRCQRFDFHRIGMQPLLARLKEVCRGAGLEVGDDALYLIARAAEGGLRDALSILDQVAAFGEKRVTAEDIHQILGTVRAEMLDEMVAALDSGDAARALRLIRTLVEQGKDLQLFIRELLAHLRNLLFLLVSPDTGEELSPSEREKLSAQAKSLGRERLLRLLSVLTRTEQEMRWSAQPGILLEVALVQVTCTGAIGTGEEARAEPGRAGEHGLAADLEQRVAKLEELLARLRESQKNVAEPVSGPVKFFPAGTEKQSPEGRGKESKDQESKDREGKDRESAEKKRSKEVVREESGEVFGEVFKGEAKIPGKDKERSGKVVPERSSQVVADGEKAPAGREVAAAAETRGTATAKTDRLASTQTERTIGGSDFQRTPAGDVPRQQELRKASQQAGEEEISPPPAGDPEGAAFQEVTARWAGFLENLKKNDAPLYSFLAYGWPQELRNGGLSIAFEKEHELHKNFLESKRKEISFAINAFFARDWQVRLTTGERPQGVDFSLRRKELDTREALSLFGITGEEE